MDKLVGWGWGDIRESQVEEWACKKAFPHLYSQRYGFSSSYGMRELDQKESWVLKNWCFQTMVLDKTLENPLDSKEIKPVNSKGNQPWIFIGRTDVEAETLILGHLIRRADSFEKTLMLGKIEGKRRRERQMVPSWICWQIQQMVGWHHWLNGHECEQTLGDSEGQGSLVCCSSSGWKEWYTT